MIDLKTKARVANARQQMDKKSLNGGGWIADAVAYALSWYKCCCSPQFSSVNWSAAATTL